MRVVIGGLKGGIGKTTTAAFLASALARPDDGTRPTVVGIDADPQSQSLYDWASLAAERGEDLGWQCLPWATPDLARRIRYMAETTDHLVVDVGGETDRLFRLALAGVASASGGGAELLIPCRPNMAEMRRIPATLAAAREVEEDQGVAVYPRVLLVAVQSSARDADEARAFLTAQKLPVMTAQVRLSVHYARAFGHAIAGGGYVGDYAAVADELRTPVTP